MILLGAVAILLGVLLWVQRWSYRKLNGGPYDRNGSNHDRA